MLPKKRPPGLLRMHLLRGRLGRELDEKRWDLGMNKDTYTELVTIAATACEIFILHLAGLLKIPSMHPIIHFNFEDPGA